MKEKEQIICDFTTGICSSSEEKEEAAPQGFVDLSTLTLDKEKNEEEA